MKKSLITFLLFINLAVFSFAQNYVSVELPDQVYRIIDYAQLNGLCLSLPGYKPYNQTQLLGAIDEILNSDLELTNTEIKVLNDYKKSFDIDYERKNNLLHINLKNTNDEGEKNASLNYHFEFDTIASGGVYNESAYSQWGMDNVASLIFNGDIGSKFSYMFHAHFDLTRMPLANMGEYVISHGERFDGPEYVYEKDPTGELVLVENKNRSRKIKQYYNMSYMPYSYDRHWDGQMYFLSNLASDGLEGWPFELGISGGLTTEIRTSFFNDKLIIGGGRYKREIAGMDNGSSLTLNSKARPFFGLDFVASPFKWLKFTSVTGILEYPNQDYLNSAALPNYDDYVGKVPLKDKESNIVQDKYGNPVLVPVNYHSSTDDATYWQNGFSINMIELDFKYFHFDFGGTCIWPKRMEFGYLFPLTVFVEYQNHLGDYDNLSLFTDMKFRYPGLGEAWVSIYLDEINGVRNNPFTATRAMYAVQAGMKYVVPKLSYATVGFRYSKIEPFCYTHHAVKTPWYDHPILENYTSGGESLGYYLPPNSDEFLLTFDWIPKDNMTFTSSMQFMRHGADYGEFSVPGSSLYSELSPTQRAEMHKYFLHDGAYNWIYAFNIGASYDFNKHNVPVKLFGNIGMVYSYWTCIDEALAKANSETGKAENIDFSTPYHIINNDMYPTLFGGLLTIGVNVSF